MEPGYVDFQVQMGKWNETKKVPVANDFASAGEALLIARSTSGVDELVDRSVHELMNLAPVDAMIADAMKSTDAGKAFVILASRKFTQAIAESMSARKWQPKEMKEVQQFVRIYATRKMLAHYGFIVNYGKAAGKAVKG
ncbi:MAG: hypothetical protein AABX02_04470 [archaeon]